MGRVLDAITDELAAFIVAQRVFFVATAPTDGGHVNLSPKGLDTFSVLDPSTVAYLDLTGSGIETVAHLRENGRITIMFCAFDGPPNIVRLHGRGRFVTLYDDGFDDLLARFPAELPEERGTRAVIVVDVDRVSDSCGYGVPLMSYEGERDLLPPYMERKGVEGRADYRRLKNRVSIDGLPGFDMDPA
jgi:predicted pyridoxine 5'-phosphate oxidase superfamily flavin-nucleotide-binding protein